MTTTTTSETHRSDTHATPESAEVQQASPVTDVEKKTIMPLHAPTLMKKYTESSQVYNNPLLPMKQNISPLEDWNMMNTMTTKIKTPCSTSTQITTHKYKTTGVHNSNMVATSLQTDYFSTPALQTPYSQCTS